MTVLEAIEQRHATKDYVDGPDITQEQLEKILEAASLAPSANNFQDSRLLIVKSKDKLKEFSKFFQGTNPGNVVNAKALFIFIGQPWEMMKDNNGKRIMDADVKYYSADAATKQKIVDGEIGYYNNISEYSDVIDIYSSAIQFSYVSLEATSLGFDSAPMLGVNKKELTKFMLDRKIIQNGERPNMYFTIGYADPQSKTNKFHVAGKDRIRKPIKDIYTII